MLKKLLKNKFFTNLAVNLAFIYIYLVHVTSKKTYINLSSLQQAKKNEAIIYAMWHSRIFYSGIILKSKTHQNYGLVSKHRDGRLIGEFIKKFNSKVIYGSTNHGGREALREILKILKNKNNHLTIIPDGPRGPSMQVNGAIIDIARITGAKILPLSYSARKCKFANSWDKFLIPKLFNEISISFGDIIEIPKTSTKKELDSYKKDLENQLNKITLNLDKKYGHKP
jgi:lysophospholipid acyltransferase (LPLAT)-like uncharacterized protein